MKRSNTIVLLTLPVLAVGLASCDAKPDKTGDKYDSYKTLEECVEDWDVKNCDLKPHPTTGELLWMGPPYSDNHKPSYKDDNGNVVERRTSSHSTFIPIFIPHSAYAPSTGVSSTPSTSGFVSSRGTPVGPSVSAPAAVSRGGFGSTASSVSSAAS